jgi:hypothetical protein
MTGDKKFVFDRLISLKMIDENGKVIETYFTKERSQDGTTCGGLSYDEKEDRSNEEV